MIDIESDLADRFSEKGAEYYSGYALFRKYRLHRKNNRTATAESIFWHTSVTTVLGMIAANYGKSHVPKSQKQKHRCQC